jgi:capsular exopolysaccharide synthesis family protein
MFNLKNMRNVDPLGLPLSKEYSPPGAIADLHSVIWLMLDRRWLIVSCLVLALIVAAIYLKRAPRVYESSTTVQVELQDAKIINVDQVVSEDTQGQEIFNTVAQRLSGRILLVQALDSNHLLPPEGIIVTNGSATHARDRLISQFAQDVKVSLRHNTRLVDITVKNTDPRLTALLANSLVESYLGQDAQLQQKANENANAFLQQEADRLEKQLETSDQALQDYRRQIGSVSLEQGQDIITPQLQDLSKQLTQSKSDLILASGAYHDSLKMSTNIDDLLAYPQIMADPEVIQIATARANSENNFDVIRKRYREKHPKYILAESTLQALDQQLAATVLKVRARNQERLGLAYQNALTAELGLETQLHITETNAMLLSDSAVRFDVLSRKVQANKALFDAVISSLGETAVAAQITPERIRVIQPAVVPDLPVSPQKKMVLASAVFGGLTVGLGISFLLNTLNTSFRTPEEIEYYLALPVLGILPKLGKSRRKRRGTAAIVDPDSNCAEAIRALRANLLISGRSNERKTYLFTSALPSEGKTFTSINYAASLAQQGLRTLIVDLDLREPMIEKSFIGKTNSMPGMSDYFLGRVGFDGICQPYTEVANLFWISAGGPVPNPAELLTQADFKRFLDESLTNFDRIVIDTSPLLPVSDTLLLADKVQTVVLVVRGCKTPRKAVERSLQLLKNARSPIRGVLLNLLPNRPLSGYNYHGYKYGSGKNGENTFVPDYVKEIAPFR